MEVPLEERINACLNHRVINFDILIYCLRFLVPMLSLLIHPQHIEICGTYMILERMKASSF